jgi:hypothetical protein
MLLAEESMMRRQHEVLEKLPLLFALLFGVVSCAAESERPSVAETDALAEVSEGGNAADALAPHGDGEQLAADSAADADADPDADPDVDGGETPNPRWLQPRVWKPTAYAQCPPPPVEGCAYEALLSQSGLGGAVGISRALYEAFGGFVAADPARLSYFHDLQEQPTAIPCTAAAMVARADDGLASSHPLTHAIADGLAAVDIAIEVGGPFEPLADTLEAALLGLGAEPGPWQQALGAVPEPVQRFVLEVLTAQAEVAAGHEAALDAVLGPEVPAWQRTTLAARIADTYTTRVISPAGGAAPWLDPDDPVALRVLAPSGAEAATFFSLGARIAQALDEAEWPSEQGAAPDFAVTVPTPLGVVALRGGGDDAWTDAAFPELAQPLLLSLDLGGDDTYRVAVGATGGLHTASSVHIDLGGNDDYGYDTSGALEVPDGVLPADSAGRYVGDDFYGPVACSAVGRQGSGIFGYAFLLDRGGGDDQYRSLRSSQGFAALGIGVLWDDGGNDVYESEATSQASAAAGVGLLWDASGNDRYRAATASQGLANPRGFALLYDRAGDDRYDLLRAPILYRWYPGGPHNISLGQGAAIGARRGDPLVNVNLGGGVGILRDFAGNDAYESAVMAQGNGYWMGFGVLADASGNDTYDAEVYAQGATEHFAIAAFLEGGGDDAYNTTRPNVPPHRNLVGTAHDFSVSVFVDDDGDDSYAGRSTSIGSAKCHGVAVFVDVQGDDTYEGLELRSLGWATDYDGAPGDCGDSTTLPTVGLFLDSGGADSYSKAQGTAPVNDAHFATDDPADPTALELGFGLDTEAPTLFSAYGSATCGTQDSPPQCPAPNPAP